MTKLTYLIIAIFMSISVANAIDKQANRTINARNFINYVYDKDVNRTLGYDSDAITFTINQDMGKAIFDSPVNALNLNNFPISDRELGNVELTRIRTVVDHSTKFVKKTKKGFVPFEAPEIISYRGRIKGQENSLVAINYTDGRMYGMIQTESGKKYNISPFNEKNIKDNNTTHAVLQTLTEDGELPFLCYTEDALPIDKIGDIDPTKHSHTLGSTSNLIMVNLAIEGDYSFYKYMAYNATRAAEYTVAVMSLASIIYEDNINVRLYASYVIINTDPELDPYIFDEDISDKLQNMKDYWQNEYYDIPRASAVLFADIRLQQTAVAGIAYVGGYYEGALCREEHGYAALGIRGTSNYPTFNYTWDVNVAAHELGHNFSSPHTHNCYWRDEWKINVIDTCIKIYDACYADNGSVPQRPRPGTIMSYCHLTNSTRDVQLYFHKAVKQKIRAHVEEVASRKDWRDSCVFIPIEKELYLLSPLGEKATLVGGQETLIRWTYQNLTHIDIYFSSDNGTNWDIIAEDVTAADSVYKWLVPSKVVSKGLILIKDADDPEVSDSTLIAFKVSSAALDITTDFKYRRIGQLATIDVEWDAEYVDSFNVYFSSDNGTNWELLVEETTSTKAQVDVPDIVSENCFIKVSSSINDEIYSLTDRFAIGKEFAELIWPEENGIICNDVPDDYRFPLKWNYDFMEQLFIFWRSSPEGTWKKISFVPIDAKDQEYGWKPPTDLTEEAQIRIAPVEEQGLEEFISHKFTIDDCAESVDYYSSYGDGLIGIEEIAPNPASSNSRLTFTINKSSERKAEIVLLDEIGNYVKHISIIDALEIGESVVNFDTNMLAQGNYFIVIRTNNAQIAAPFKVLR